MTDEITVVPANEAPGRDLAAVFGRGDAAWCRCQWFKLTASQLKSSTREERADRLRAQTRCGEPSAPATSGLVAYLDGEPAGWVAVEPRTAYPRLATARIP